MASPVAPSPSVGLALRAVVTWLLDALARALAQRLRETETAERDPAWGMVSQRCLPEWISAEAYVDACRAGKVAGARIWRRQWLAPREAVLAWVDGESRATANSGEADALDTESDAAILAANGIHIQEGK